MEEASDSDYVVILDSGKVVAEGSPHELKNKFASDYIKFYNNMDKAEEYFENLGKNIKRERDFVIVEIIFAQNATVTELTLKTEDNNHAPAIPLSILLSMVKSGGKAALKLSK